MRKSWQLRIYIIFIALLSLEPLHSQGGSCEKNVFRNETHSRNVVYSGTGRARWVLKPEKNSIEDKFPGVSQIVWFHFKLLKYPPENEIQKFKKHQINQIFTHAQQILLSLKEVISTMTQKNPKVTTMLLAPLQNAQSEIETMRLRLSEKSKDQFPNYTYEMLRSAKSRMFEVFVATRLANIRAVSIHLSDMEEGLMASHKEVMAFNREFDLHQVDPQTREETLWEVKNNGFMYKQHSRRNAEFFIDKIIEQVRKQRSILDQLGARQVKINIIFRYPLPQGSLQRLLDAGASEVVYLMESFEALYE
ncbi:hypothetical protein GW915_04330 [bacterium]|nr:hypothetical protein [bacterium]